MMGQLIRNKLLTGKSTIILSFIETLVSTFEEMYEMNLNHKEVSPGSWINALSNSYQLLSKFQNLSTLLKYSHDDTENKIEGFNVVETVKNLSNILSMSTTNHEFDVDLSFEAGIPDRMYGYVQRFKQILTILLTVAYREAKADIPTTCEVKFLRIDEKRNYVVGIDVGIPKTSDLEATKLNKIFSNSQLGTDFFVDFKDELQKYDIGIFL